MATGTRVVGIGANRALLERFAAAMRERHSAAVYLFGSRARRTARPDSDYDLVAVSPSFESIDWYRRSPDTLQLWIAAGGWGIGLDLQCYTPSEFAAEVEGLGYLGSAKRRGELKRVLISKRAAA